MDRILIRGGIPLVGEVCVSGAKNAALPLMVACLLSDESLQLSNIPHLADITHLARLLGQLGVEVHMNWDQTSGRESGHVLTLTARNLSDTTAPYDIVRKMRASFLVLGPLLARAGQAKVSLPGGCAIGARPVDLHLMALEALGARIALEDGYVIAEAPHGLKGAHIRFPFNSVGATENALMSAALADGDSVIENAACEPEIADLARCLNAMGADISGAGTRKIEIRGRERLHGARHVVLPDRIETGTYAVALALAGGSLTIKGSRFELIETPVSVLASTGVDVSRENDDIRISRPDGRIRSADVQTEPFPGFPTDLQAQVMALLCTAEGVSHVRETIFENRFMHVPELSRMGADISVDGQTATIRGVRRLAGTQVMATDLRASMCLVLAGLAAEGETVVNRVYHLDRGFERIEEKLGQCGAHIVRLKDERAPNL